MSFMIKHRGWRVVALVLISLSAFSATTGEAASWDISGPWVFEGTGYVDWKGIRSSLALDGDMNISTIESGDIWAVTSYDLNLNLDATRAGIGVWDDHLEEAFHDHIPLLESMNPSLGRPFELPAITTEDGLTYKITLTSTTSGKIDISGEDAALGRVGGLKIGSDSGLWKKGTSKPALANASSGCNAGGPGLLLGALLVLASLPAHRVFREFRVK